MAANILAYIQFDDNSSPDQEIFSTDPSVWDFTNDLCLWECKDYDFISAISGVRNKRNKQPLISLRGLPQRKNGLTRIEDIQNVGWLNYSEIFSCLDYFSISVNELDLAVRDVLSAMDILQKRYGDKRVRFVFAIMD